ncbi:polysaccharide deacetylase family protein [Bacillus badius]|uniref:Polysaccharide deacetylase n=1 Tax=Bacillus badius TaxID=1455 RepID=A0ABR5AWB4_BACBA|nr:polysaccharide deacetylase family protein [Bacillus badius]KIL74562.1 Polysaccharide deacetylase [Bacillus badius]KIL79030.1 Polysaccharide deacetylase [Bacillus badius]MED4715534.1 polysaccharide deacetylase family protein [Bacillus badius]
MKARCLLLSTCVSLCLLQGCSQKEEKESIPAAEKEVAEVSKKAPEEVMKPLDLSAFERKPVQWGEQVDGVKTRMETDEKKMALTFDACGGTHGSGYDEELLSFLRAEQVPATLFLNERWIQANKALFLELAADPLFQIENHGTEHAPLSVAGGEAWGIEATASPQAVYDEIMSNHQTVKALTGKEMTMFRSGTAYYDEVAVQLAEELGYQVVNFDVLGDAGATFSSEQVKQALISAKEGAIALLHMNQPQSGTAEGVKQAVPVLREQGYEFVLLGNETLE